MLKRVSLLEISEAILTLFPEYKDVRVMVPKREFGDLSSNFPMLMAKQLKVSPMSIFNDFKDRLEALKYIDKVEFVSGFCNFRLCEEFFHETLSSMQKEDFGFTDVGCGMSVNIEYISANPTGNLHLGHLRGLYADCLANLLEFVGYKVTREYYVNDLGNQIEVLGKSVLYNILIQQGHECTKPKELYSSDEIDQIANDLRFKYPERLNKSTMEDFSVGDAVFCGSYTVDAMIRYIKAQLKYMGINFDVWRRESDLKQEGFIDKGIEILEKAGAIKTGILGDVIAKRGQSSNQEIKIFKDAKAVTKPNGSHTYFGADIGYFYDKIKRGFDWIIYCVGAEQAPNFGFLEEIAPLFNYEGKTSVISFQTIDMAKDGYRMKFSKRGGTVVRPMDLDLPTPDVLRMMILSKRTDTHFSIDMDEVSKISEKNKLYFILNALKRVRIYLHEPFPLSKSLNLIHLLSQFPQKVIHSIDNVSSLFEYIMDIASEVNEVLKHPNSETSTADNHFQTHFDMVLVFKAAVQIIEKILGVIGIDPAHYKSNQYIKALAEANL